MYAKSTQSKRISETGFFKHKYLTNPTVTHADRVVQATKELHRVLERKKQGVSGDTMQALRDLSKLFLDTPCYMLTPKIPDNQDTRYGKPNTVSRLNFSSKLDAVEARTGSCAARRALRAGEENSLFTRILSSHGLLCMCQLIAWHASTSVTPLRPTFEREG